MFRLDTNQGLPLRIIQKKLLVTPLDYVDDVYNSIKVVHIQANLGVFEIFYNYDLRVPLVRTIDGSWYYVGNIKTTIHEIISYFSCGHFIVKNAFDYENNTLTPDNQMIFDPVSSSFMLSLIEP